MSVRLQLLAQYRSRLRQLFCCHIWASFSSFVRLSESLDGSFSSTIYRREWVGCYLASEIIALSIMLGLVYRQWRRKRVDIGARPPPVRGGLFSS